MYWRAVTIIVHGNQFHLAVAVVERRFWAPNLRPFACLGPEFG